MNDQALDLGDEDDEGSPGETDAVVRRHGAVHARYVRSTEELAQVMPTIVAPNESWHVISRGDVDALSFIERLLDGLGHADFLLISTWRINVEGLSKIREWLDDGRVERFDLVIDVSFQRLGPDQYLLAREMAHEFGGRVVLSKNHSKVVLLRSGAAKLVIETSSNININRRIEQTAVHHSAPLFDFYNEFFGRLGRPLQT